MLLCCISACISLPTILNPYTLFLDWFPSCTPSADWDESCSSCLNVNSVTSAVTSSLDTYARWVATADSADSYPPATINKQVYWSTASKILKRRETIYQIRPYLSQMRTTKYMPFTWKKSGFCKKNIWANWRGWWGAPPPLQSAAEPHCITLHCNTACP